MEQSNIRRYGRPILRILGNIIQLLAHWFFKLVYLNRGNTMPPINDLLLLDSVTTIAKKIRTRKITSEQVLDSFIERIKEINPLLNCVVSDRFDEARNEARSADKLIKSGKLSEEILEKEKPLLGVPFTTKDCIAIKDMIHTAGLKIRKNIVATDDADVILALRNAGAFPIALTNVSELCMWWESSNTLHGRTSNPYDTNHIVGGSSGGEGCCQAACGSAFGIGSDIGGSIRMPCFFNGIFGHKPSKFTVSNKGQYPIPVTKEQNSFLGIGPMCRRAEDLLPILKIIVGPQNVINLKLGEDIDIKKLKFFYQDNDGGSIFVSPVNGEIKGLFKKITLYLQKAHDIKTQQVNLRRFIKSGPLWFANMKAPNGPSFASQLANLNGEISPRSELIKWIFNQSNHTLIGIITAIADKLGVEYGDPKHTYLVKECDNFKLEMNDLLGDNGVFLYPTHPTAAPFHNEPLLKPFNFSYTAIINILGLPATHIPMGLNKEGLPIGIQCVASNGNDRFCLAVAREFEKAFGGWVPPKIQA